MESCHTVRIRKDGRVYDCSVYIQAVRGGKQVVYTVEDGTVVMREPLCRYNKRFARRVCKVVREHNGQKSDI